MKYISKIKNAEVLCGFITSKFSKEILEKLPNLKFIATMSTGFDHIDLDYCKSRNIKVSNVPYYGENTVAEHAFALILALSRKIVSGANKTKDGDFSFYRLRGFDLKDKTIGIIGLGNIGKHVAKMAKGFDMKIIAQDPYKDLKFAKKYDIKYYSLNSLLKRSDVITLHVPHMKSTHHLINKENIKFIKKGAILINTARGGLIETEALLWALERDLLKGVGLDVLEEEALLKNTDEMLIKQLHKNKLTEEQIKILLEDHVLIDYDNVIVTPHNAFNSEEALLRILNTTIINIRSYCRKKIRNQI